MTFGEAAFFIFQRSADIRSRSLTGQSCDTVGTTEIFWDSQKAQRFEGCDSATVTQLGHPVGSKARRSDLIAATASLRSLSLGSAVRRKTLFRGLRKTVSVLLYPRSRPASPA
jgi:hypothetical protein